MSRSSQQASSTVPGQDPSLTDAQMTESGGDAAQFPGAVAGQFHPGDAAQSSVPSTIIVDSSIAQTV